MYRTKSEIHLHFVWSVQDRERRLANELRRDVYRIIASEAAKLGRRIHAIGGMKDHVHLAVEVPTSLTPAHPAQVLQDMRICPAYVSFQVNE